MARHSEGFDAVFEGGVLRPVEPIDLPENVLLHVTVNHPKDAIENLIDWDAHDYAEHEGDETIPLAAIDEAVADLIESMSEVVVRLRDERSETFPKTLLRRNSK